MRPASIRARLLIWSGALTLVALGLAWMALSVLLSEFIERRLKAELVASANVIMAASQWDELGAFSVVPPPADPRFERPLSGWFWQVADGAEILARAPALLDSDLGVDGLATSGPDGAALVTYRDGFTAPGDGRELTVTVTLPAGVAAAELAAIRGPLVLALVILGAALMAAQIVAVRLGLSDLTRFARGVAAVRDGKARRMPRPKAAELRPLADELDRLIAVNAAQLDRARAHAGDLAHALKTPLSVLANRAAPEEAALIDRMDRTIRWHLKRARSAAEGLDPAAACAVAPVLTDISLVLSHEAERQGVSVRVMADTAPDFRGDAEDLTEIVGALAENAVQWARTEVHLIARRETNGLLIEVADDGPGIPADQRERLLTRGARLDETTHGHGLGLAIAADRVRVYAGEIVLCDSATGGLSARVTLPASRQFVE